MAIGLCRDDEISLADGKFKQIKKGLNAVGFGVRKLITKFKTITFCLDGKFCFFFIKCNERKTTLDLKSYCIFSNTIFQFMWVNLKYNAAADRFTWPDGSAQGSETYLRSYGTWGDYVKLNGVTTILC